MCFNVTNEEDNECFKWSITRAIYPAQNHPSKMYKQLKENSEKFDWDGIHFSASFKDIDKYGKLYPSISINVLSYEQELYPLRITTKANDKTVNLLLISKGENQHYCWIKNMSRLLISQISKNRIKNILLSDMIEFILHDFYTNKPNAFPYQTLHLDLIFHILVLEVYEVNHSS